MSREMVNSGIPWIGEIPKGWRIAQLKRFCKVNSGREIETEVERSSVDAIPVFGSGGVFKYTNKPQHIGEAVMFGRKGTLGKPMYVNGTFWAVDTMYFLTFTNILRAKYCFYLLSAFNWEPYITQTALPSVVATDIVNADFVFPSIIEQQKVASFLDRKCAEIDEMIALQEKIVEELKAYKHSVITEAVTKGLNPDAPMKDSGIEWIGEIPEHWNTRKIGTLFRLRDEKNYKSMDEVQLLSLYTGIGVFPHGEQEERGNKAVTVEGYKVVHKNDIVVNIILAWMGAIGISDYDGVTSPAYDVYIPSTSVIPHYYHYVFRTKGIAGECYKYGRGIMMMRWRTYSSEFKQISIPLPSMEEQQEIADYLDEKCSGIDNLINIKLSKIDCLKEYKKSIIYEYVTGKKEVI